MSPWYHFPWANNAILWGSHLSMWLFVVWVMYYKVKGPVETIPTSAIHGIYEVYPMTSWWHWSTFRFPSKWNCKDLGKPTYTLVPCWMSNPWPPRNECMGCFAPTNCKESLVLGMHNEYHEHCQFKFETRSGDAEFMRVQIGYFSWDLPLSLNDQTRHIENVLLF